MRLRNTIKKHQKKIIGFVLLAIVLSIPLFYIAAVSEDWYWFPLNPPPPPTLIIIPMMIPPTVTNATPWPDLYLGISLQANGTIAEGVEVMLAGAGSIASHNYYLRLSGVEVFFQKSIPWRFKNSPTLSDVMKWPAVITLERNLTNLSDDHLLPYINNTEIYFPAAGDYSPTVLVIFKQDKAIECTYDSIKIHVASSSEIQNAKLTRVNTLLTYALVLLTYALVLFAVIESTSIMRDFTEDRTKK